MNNNKFTQKIVLGVARIYEFFKIPEYSDFYFNLLKKYGYNPILDDYILYCDIEVDINDVKKKYNLSQDEVYDLIESLTNVEYTCLNPYNLLYPKEMRKEILDFHQNNLVLNSGMFNSFIYSQKGMFSDSEFILIKKAKKNNIISMTSRYSTEKIYTMSINENSKTGISLDIVSENDIIKIKKMLIENLLYNNILNKKSQYIYYRGSSNGGYYTLLRFSDNSIINYTIVNKLYELSGIKLAKKITVISGKTDNEQFKKFNDLCKSIVKEYYKIPYDNFIVLAVLEFSKKGQQFVKKIEELGVKYIVKDTEYEKLYFFDIQTDLGYKEGVFNFNDDLKTGFLYFRNYDNLSTENRYSVDDNLFLLAISKEYSKKLPHEKLSFINKLFLKNKYAFVMSNELFFKLKMIIKDMNVNIKKGITFENFYILNHKMSAVRFYTKEKILSLYNNSQDYYYLDLNDNNKDKANPIIAINSKDKNKRKTIALKQFLLNLLDNVNNDKLSKIIEELNSDTFSLIKYSGKEVSDIYTKKCDLYKSCMRGSGTLAIFERDKRFNILVFYNNKNDTSIYHGRALFWEEKDWVLIDTVYYSASIEFLVKNAMHNYAFNYAKEKKKDLYIRLGGGGNDVVVIKWDKNVPPKDLRLGNYANEKVPPLVMKNFILDPYYKQQLINAKKVGFDKIFKRKSFYLDTFKYLDLNNNTLSTYQVSDLQSTIRLDYVGRL